MSRNNISLLTFTDTGVFTGGDISRKDYIPNPSQYSIGQNDIDLNSKRSTSGYLQRNMVRANALTVSCTWDRLSEHQLDLLMISWSGAKFSLKFRFNDIDPNTRKVTSRFITSQSMYVEGSRTFELVSTESDTQDYWSVSITFIEY